VYVADPRALIIEDDATLRKGVRAVLDRSGYDVLALADGCELAQVVDRFRPDVAILDVRLPDGADGFALGAWLRANSDVPIVYVTAADALEDRLRGFELGADDYLVKPFSMAELLARLRAVLRRSGRLSSLTIEVRDVVIDESTREVRRSGRLIELTKTEFDLLSTLARSRNRVLSKTQLLTEVWGFDQYDPNVVEVHVSALRRKLEEHGPRLIHTERGSGYVLRA
jgi:two-component system OmpR family response regulator